MKLAIILAAMLPFACFAEPATGDQPLEKETVCTCKDLRDMRNRVCEARAAIREYTRLEQQYYDDERKKKTVLIMDPFFKSEIKGCAMEAMDLATDGGAQNASGETNASCKIDYVIMTRKLPNSLCMAESVNKHEGYHATQCKIREENKWVRLFDEDVVSDPITNYTRGPISVLVDSRYTQSVLSYLAEERTAYALEEIRLRIRMQQLVLECNPAERLAKVTSNDHLPGKKSGDNYQLDLSWQPCPARPRQPKGTSVCARL